MGAPDPSGPTPAPREVADGIRDLLAASADPVRAEAERRYLHSDRVHLGVSVPECRRVVRGAVSAAGISGRDLVALARELWASDVFEHRRAAVEVLRRAPVAFPDLVWVEEWLREARTWALVDDIAPRVVGGVLRAEGGPSPRSVELVERWSRDPDLWIRRSSVLSLLIILGDPDGGEEWWPVFCARAETLAGDREFFVRKALGWVMRDAGRRRPDALLAFLEPRVREFSGLTVREAVKYLPAQDAARLRTPRRGGA